MTSSDSSPSPPGAPALSPLKRAFLALEAAEARVADLERAAREPIAIIGLACRVPGADDPESFWRLLETGQDVVSATPADRWDAASVYDPNPETPGRIAALRAGFLRGPVDRFDAGLFGIAPREAQSMDPQQRLLLEVTWEALEDAGKAPDKLEHSSTGVYVGLCASDYANLQLKTHDATLLDAHFTSGIAHSIASGRISYLLGLQGPSLTIDTACSSSLVAVHLACQALRSGDCKMALAAGVNLMLAPDLYMALSRARMLSPEGRCKTFDASADGFARGEGCGVVVLKRLRDAEADGDRILGVIRGSAVNQDGPSGSLTAPNGPAQEAVIHQALARAGLSPNDVGYVEAHGTGTELGDPLEVQALGAVFGQGRDPALPLWLASVKTNIGHLEGAAGVVGLIKLALCLQHQKIPEHLHFRNPSPHIPWADLPFRVPTALSAWEPIAGRRIGGVSSFGFSGTNAHVVLEEGPLLARSAGVTATGATTTGAAERSAQLLVLSARDEKALRELAARYVVALAGRSDEELADVCFTAAVGRAHLPFRATVIARTMAELQQRVAAVAQGQPAEGVTPGRMAPRDPPRVAFLFTGQGAQYAGMTRGLYATAPVFRAALDRVAALLAPRLARPLLEVLFPEPGATTPLDDTGYTQPALFAVEYALTQLWRSWGVAPNMVIGHSVGEYAAACAAGVLELEDATRLIAERGRLMQSLPAGGAMAAIFAPEARVAEAIAPHKAKVSIGAVNGPEQTVISGGAADVEAVCRAFTAQGVRCKPLVVSHAFHSPLVDPILASFEHEASTARFSPARLPLVSNVTGRLAEPGLVTEPAYWRKHVREAVRFGEGLTALSALRPDVAVEIGPQPTLLTFAKAVYGDAGPALVPSLKKGRADDEQILDAAAALFLAGAELDFRGLANGHARRLVALPPYPFQRERFWFRAKAATVATASQGRAAGHPLLGTRLRSAGTEIVYEAPISADAPAFVRQHRVQGRVIVPATAYLEALLAAAERALGSERVSVGDVTVGEAMILEEDGSARTMQLVCGPPRDGVIAVSLSSLAEGADDTSEWIGHVTAQMRAAAAPSAGPSLADARSRCARAITPAEHYAGFERRGLDFGPGFKAVRQLAAGDHEALGLAELSDDLAKDAHAYRVHPVLLDGCLQVLAAAIGDEKEDALFLPIGIGSYTRYGSPGLRCWSHVVVQPGGGETRRAGIRLFDEQGELLAELRDVQLKRVSRDALARIGERWLDDAMYETAWRDVPTTVESASMASTVSLDALAAACTGSLPRLRKEAQLDAYDPFVPRPEAHCADYTVRAMTRLGWAPSVGETVQETALADRLAVATRHRRLFGRLLAILAESRWLERGPKGFTVTRPFTGVDPVRDLGRLMLECPEGTAELEMTGRTGGEMAEALRGEREPMQLLFPGGSLETAERLYRDTPTAKLYNGLVAEALSALAKNRSEGRPLRILEIGGGTGGTTSHVLPRLPMTGIEYTFTDVGPLFVARARERFAKYPYLKFATIDLERDPEAQGFAETGFDVIIASNVIHATARLRSTLTRVRRLLAPGGLLTMLEVTAPQRWFDLTVGLTDGWWAFDDVDLRPDYATMPRDKWLALLKECGFDDARALPEGHGHTGSLSLQSLIIARASASPQARRNWLIFADRGGFAASLAERLAARGDSCTLVEAGATFAGGVDGAVVDPASPSDPRRLLRELAAAGRAPHGVVHAWSLDAPAWENTTAEDLATAAARGAVSGVYLAQALVAANPPPRLWLLTRGGQQADALDRSLGPAQAPVWGLGKTLRREHPEVRCVCVDVDPAESASLDTLIAELDAKGTEPEVALRKGGRRVARLVRSKSLRSPTTARTTSPFRLVPTTPGSLDAFTLEPRERRPPGPGEVEIRVEATGLNFKDVLNALGMYPGDPGPLGGECAGTVVAVGAGVTHVRPGDDVLAVAAASFASHVVARSEFVQPRPLGVTAEEGATFPIAFLTAAFCLDHLAKMRSGERVLIHAAAGGVGMAAVRLAQRAGAEVFATAGSPWKRELLRSLGVQHVLDSRSASFADAIEKATGGRGVDIVLNSLSGDLIDASFRVLAPGGRFVEIGKRGIKDHPWVAALGQRHSYFIVDWGETGAREPALIGALLERLVAELRDGTLTALPRHVFGLDEASRAFRFMAQARHVGRIVVRHGPPPPASVRGDGTYLVTGGLSGLGPVVAAWLVEHGAGRVVLVGRRQVTPEVSAVLDTLRRRGTTIVTESVDVSDETALRALLARLRSEGPALRGIVHSAGVLDDAGLLQQDAARMAHVFAPKVRGGWLLDGLTRGDPLDWFVLFSSAAAVLGSPGQANHSAANAFLDLLARERKSRGLAGLSINWGAWGEVGAAADRGITERLAAQGLGALTTEQGKKAFERSLNDGRAQVAVIPVEWRRYVGAGAGGETPPFLAELVGAESSVTAATGARAGEPAARPVDLRQQLADVPRGRRRPMVAAFVRERALGALGLDATRAVDPETPLGELGLDSLLAVELRNTLSKALARPMPATLLFDYPTLDTLTDYILKEAVGDEPKEADAPPPPAEPANLVGDIEDLSDEEVERQLRALGSSKKK